MAYARTTHISVATLGFSSGTTNTSNLLVSLGLTYTLSPKISEGWIFTAGLMTTLELKICENDKIRVYLHFCQKKTTFIRQLINDRDYGTSKNKCCSIKVNYYG